MITEDKIGSIAYKVHNKIMNIYMVYSCIHNNRYLVYFKHYSFIIKWYVHGEGRGVCGYLS